MTNDIVASSAWQFVKQQQRHLNTAVVVLLGIYLISLLADITWQLIPQPANSALPQQSAIDQAGIAASPVESVNLKRLQQLHLFGNPQAEPAKPIVPAVASAPQTRLNLKLTGLVLTTKAEAGTAVIAYQGRQATYGVGEPIENTNASVEKVLSDRIIIRNGSNLETLMLEGLDFTKMAENQRSAPQRGAGAPPSLRSTQARLRPSRSVPAETLQKLRSDPRTFTDYFSIAPLQVNGKLQGYRINPGKDKDLFLRSGLQPNDVITAINGLDLTNPSELAAAARALKTEPNMQVRIIRNGATEEFFIELPPEHIRND